MNWNGGRLRDLLTDILTAIERIDRYTAEIDEVAFLSNTLVQDAVVRNLEIIGEASRNIDRKFPEFATAHPDLPFAYAYQMRNALAHGYGKVDFEIVWRTIQNDLPDLHRRLREAVAGLEPGS